MRKTGFALLFVAGVLSAVHTAIFGASFWEELSSWLLIVVALLVAGFTLVSAGFLARAGSGVDQAQGA